MNIYDTFIYNNEDLILDIRLNYLNKFVEKFIIVEAKFTHQGKEKKNFLNLSNFNKFKNKITYLFIENFPPNLSNWGRENFQRNYISKSTKDLLDDDYIIISDVDEIPNFESLNNFEKYKFTAFEQLNFCYKFNMKNMTYPKWYGSKLCKKKYLKSPQWLRNLKVREFSFFQFYKTKWNIIRNGGWHFSFLMKPSEIKNKIKSFAHDEFNKKEFLEIDQIKQKIKLGKDLFNRDQKYIRVNIDNKFPKQIFDNMDKYKEWIV